MLERLRRWTADTRRVDIAAAVNVEVRDTAHGERNRVRIDHRLPAPGDSAEWRFRVTTHRQMLPSAHFDPAVRRKVHEAAQERGRRIFAIERTSQEVVAVLGREHEAPRCTDAEDARLSQCAASAGLRAQRPASETGSDQSALTRAGGVSPSD